MAQDSTLLDIVVGHVKSARGRSPAPLSMSVVRELGEQDLDLINNPPPKGVSTAPILKLRQSHHNLARLLADGVRPVEASAITGYSPSRVSILQQDPAFKELLAYYAEQKQQRYFDVHERLASLGTDAAQEIQDRLEEKPESFTNRELMTVVELTMDRTVAPKKSTSVPPPTTALPPAINIQFITPPAHAQAPAQAQGTMVTGGLPGPSKREPEALPSPRPKPSDPFTIDLDEE